MLLDNRTAPVIEVEVTQEDIQRGARDCATDCALALALLRSTGERWVVLTNGAYGSGGRTYLHDGKAFVDAFDSGGIVHPTVVRLWPAGTARPCYVPGLYIR